MLIPCVALWVLLWSLGMLNEGRMRARLFESLRLVGLLPALLVALHVQGEGLSQGAWIAAAAYVLASLTWLAATQGASLITIKNNN